MHVAQKKKVVLLGMMSQMPVAGVVWQTMHYLIGLRRLGYDVFYVEAHGSTPRMLLQNASDDAAELAADFIAGIAERFDFRRHWAFHAVHQGGQCYGMTYQQLLALYSSAELIINMHGGTTPLPEHSQTGRLVYLETDPVQLQVELKDNNQQTVAFLEPHIAFFTFGENYANADCRLPVTDRFQFHATRQPVVLDFWASMHPGDGAAFTTIGNWRQPSRVVRLDGEVYRWSKHLEFSKFLELPARSCAKFELALGQYTPEDRDLLENCGWKVRNAPEFTVDPGSYRAYIQQSRGEFTVAKDQNVRLRTGWFSDRSATYLAAGRPVITQDTAFSNMIPTGQGLFAFSTMDHILGALENINSNYERHCSAAYDIARNYFSYDVVLPRMLSALGLPAAPAIAV